MSKRLGKGIEALISSKNFNQENISKKIESLSLANIIDIGAESSRPGSKPIPINEEIERLKKINVIDLPFDYISIDSYKYEVIKYALNSEDKMKKAIGLAKKYKKNYKRIIDGLKKKVEFPPPLVVKDSKGTLYLLGGNSRLMLGVAMGYNLPVKVIDWSKEIQ